jgi:hypothetical protein
MAKPLHGLTEGLSTVSPTIGGTAIAFRGAWIPAFLAGMTEIRADPSFRPGVPEPRCQGNGDPSDPSPFDRRRRSRLRSFAARHVLPVLDRPHRSKTWITSEGYHRCPFPSALSACSRQAVAVALCLVLAACGTAPKQAGEGTWAGQAIGSPPPPNPALKQAMIERATREWEFFGRQTVVMKGSAESIPRVGSWEDDGGRYSARVNTYWRAVGKPQLDGLDCRAPWSAAFMSWVIQGAGVPEGQFPPSQAHGVYLASLIEDSAYSGRYFVPRRITDYSPEPGDLICAYRGTSRADGSSSYASAWSLRSANAHCDLVVDKKDGTLETIGGNVRNSVSKVTLELDGNGRLQPVPRRPWFLILENRL